MPPKKRPRGYRTQITESLLERVLKIVSDVVDWAQNATTIPTLYRRPPMLSLRFGGRRDIWHTFWRDESDNPRRGRTWNPIWGRDDSWGYLQ